jgi:DNA-binding transcriptional MerR regulator
MTSGELAKLAGVSVDTLHHYEKRGVLPAAARGGNGYRDYPSDAADRVNTIRRALAMGFTLDELARIFAIRAGGAAPCRMVRRLAADKLQQLDTRISDLIALREELRLILDDWDRRLDAAGQSQPAHLLESLRRNA